MSERRFADGSTRVLGYAILVAVIVASLELLSFLAVSAARHEWFTYSRLQQARAALSEPGAPTSQPKPAAPELPGFVGTEVIHPYLGFVLDRSFARCNPAMGGYRDALDYGFSCGEVPFVQQRTPGKVIVGLFGGSVAYGFQALGAPILRRELQRSGPLAGSEIVFVPLALPGYKQPQQLLALTYFLTLGAEFDLVVNLDGFNEIVLPVVENVPKGVFPLFPRSWLFRVGMLDAETREQMGAVYYLKSRRAAHAALFSRRPLRYSTTASLLWTIVDRYDVAMARRLQAKLLRAPADAAPYVARGPYRAAPDEPSLYTDLAAAWRSSSVQMHRLCEANGTAYFHFLQPNQYVAGSKPIGEDERRQALGDPYGFAHSVEIGYPLLRSNGTELAAAGVRFHDLTRVFAGEQDPVYVDACCHFNARGYELVAQAMARAIVTDVAASRGAATRVGAGAGAAVRTARR